MTESVREYESVFILDPTLDDTRVQEEVERAQEILREAGGTIDEVEAWGRRRLAYEIRKKRDGVYTLLRYRGPGGIVREFERRMRINENVLRVLSVVIDAHMKRAMESAKRAEAEAAAAARAAEEAAETTTAETATATAGGEAAPVQPAPEKASTGDVIG